MSIDLFASYALGSLHLQNRLVMAPLTRSRASNDHVPTPLMAEYYGQRSSAGLIVTEGTSPSPNGLGYARIPGLFDQEHVAAWKPIVARAHEGGAKIFVQLMHTGRVGHALNLPKDARVLAPSAIRVSGQIFTDQEGLQDYPVPEEMSSAQIEHAVHEYVRSAKLAIEAGFDGVELHGANGYLIDQFLHAHTNHRNDEWGGDFQERSRFAVEVAIQVAGAIGPHRVGIRFSPFGANADQKGGADEVELYTYLATKMQEIGIAYVHVVDHSAMGAPKVGDEVKAAIRKNFKGTYILSGGYDLERAKADLAEGKGDLVAFGRPFLTTPNLVEALQAGKAPNAPDMSTFYTPGAKGYTDYPAV